MAMTPDRIPLEWKREHLSSGEGAFLGGARVGGYYWQGGNGSDAELGPWRLSLGRPPYLPTTRVPTRQRYETSELAKEAVERHVARTLRRLVNAARREGWVV